MCLPGENRNALEVMFKSDLLEDSVSVHVLVPAQPCPYVITHESPCVIRALSLIQAYGTLWTHLITAWKHPEENFPLESMKGGYLHCRPKSQGRFFLCLCATHDGKERLGRYQVKLAGCRIKTKKKKVASLITGTQLCPGSGQHIQQVIGTVHEGEVNGKPLRTK